MKLSARKSMLLYIIGILLILSAVFTASASYVFLRSAIVFEQSQAAKNADRINFLIKEELESLSASVSDYATWDDTCAFVSGTLTNYTDQNFQPTTFIRNRISSVFIFNDKGKAVFSMSISPDLKSLVPPFNKLATAINSIKDFIKHEDESCTHSSFLKANGLHILAASAPIITSDGKGPVRGSLVFIRNIDAAFLEKLGKKIQFDTKLFNPDSQEIPGHIRAKILQPVPDSPIVDKADSSLFNVYVPIRDSSQQITGIFRIAMKRDVYLNALSNLRLIVISMLIITLITSGIIVLIIDWIVLKRIDEITIFLDSTLQSPERNYKRLISDKGNKLLPLVRRLNELFEEIEKEKRARLTSDKALSDERFLAETYLRLAPVMFIALNKDGNITMINQHGCEFLGRTAIELIGKNWFDNFIPKDNIENIKAVFNKLMAGDIESVENFENSIIGAHGRERIISWHNTMIKDDKGNISGILSAGVDITDQHHANEQIKQQRDELQQAISDLETTQNTLIETERTRALVLMASGIAHDFNNLLTPIVGIADLLINNPELLNDRKEATAMLNDIRTAGLDARDAIKRLRDIYRPDNRTNYKEVTIESICDKAVSLTKPKWQEEARAKGINIAIKMELKETKTMVYGNESQLREVIINLILNSVDAMPSGGTITIRSQKTSGNQICISVIDDGLGFSAETLPNAFKPFYSTKGLRGTGIGLPMAKTIIDRHSGSISIKPDVLTGAQVDVFLPVFDPSMKKTEPEQNMKYDIKLNILIVDDEKESLSTASKIVEALGHVVITASSGKEAINLLKDQKIDLVITDRAMPKMSGDQLAAEIKKVNGNIPIIMLTGFGDLTEPSEYPPGINIVISKPTTAAELNSAIIKAMAA